ncbi:MAG: hypothetical protein R2741_03295 [Methanolobus sp.]
MSKNDVILAYCFRINEEGLTSSYTGKTGKDDDDESLVKIHDNAADWYQKQVLEVDSKNDTVILTRWKIQKKQLSRFKTRKRLMKQNM